MNILLDTNILIHLAKDSGLQLLNRIINSGEQKIFVSIVSVGELRSIALRNNWGVKKWRTINTILDNCIIIELCAML